MLEGFKRSQIQRPLVIVGDANYKSRFVEELKKSAGTQVLFLGHISDSQHLRELFCNAYAYLHGHTVGGTNPALLQSLGSGNCILAHANSLNREVLNGHGMLFPAPAPLTANISPITTHPS